MAYLIIEWIGDLQRELYAARAIHKRYSEAWLHTVPDAMLGRVMPDYETRRQHLKLIGPRLEW